MPVQTHNILIGFQVPWLLMSMAVLHWSELSLLELDVPNQITLESMPESLLRKTGFWQILMLENARINANALFDPES